ncbi:cation-efflux pump, partial [Staphylococcus aureus]
IGHATIQMESENHPHKDSVMCRDDDITHSHEH